VKFRRRPILIPRAECWLVSRCRADMRDTTPHSTAVDTKQSVVGGDRWIGGIVGVLVGAGESPTDVNADAEHERQT
jgi:hypothetical protein